MFRKINHLVLLGASFKLKLLRPLAPPYQYSIEATNYCNFSCSFCPQSNPEHKNVRKYGFLSLEDLRLFLKKRKAVKSGSSIISICLDGEPLMNNFFPDFIRIINQENLYPRFSSNGKLFVPELTDKLVRSGNFLASIDFASNAEIFEKIRGKEGDFDIVCNNLKYLIKVARSNSKIKLEIIDISHFTGIDPKLSLKKMRALFSPRLPSNIRFWSRKFHNFAGHIEAKCKTGRYKVCPYPWFSFVVAWNGDVVACCRDTEAKTVLGNIFKQSISDIWFGKKYVEMRKCLLAGQVEKIKACAECDLPWSGGKDRWKLSYMLSSLLRR